MKMNKKQISSIFIIVLLAIFIISLIALFFGDFLDQTFDVIGIRVTALILSFASFGSSTLFSLLVYQHNKTVSQLNDDTNRRAELFRDLQFASSNYSIIEFMDRMLVTKENPRYIERLTKSNKAYFHLFDDRTNNPLNTQSIDDFKYFTIRIPFKLIEGKIVSSIKISELRFERDQKTYSFFPNIDQESSQTFILNNELTQRSNMIINLAVNKNSDFFDIEDINLFSKIKIYLNITSLLNVMVQGQIELYFTNPNQEEALKHSYRIISSHFRLKERPQVIPYIDEL